jgi:hypothetical protein
VKNIDIALYDKLFDFIKENHPIDKENITKYLGNFAFLDGTERNYREIENKDKVAGFPWV